MPEVPGDTCPACDGDVEVTPSLRADAAPDRGGER